MINGHMQPAMTLSEQPPVDWTTWKLISSAVAILAKQTGLEVLMPRPIPSFVNTWWTETRLLVMFAA